MREIARKSGIFIILAGIFLIASLATKEFFTYTNLTNLIRQGAITGILAVGQTLVILTGGIDLSVGSLVALASVVGATLMPYSIALSVFMTLLTCTALGAVSGFMVARARIAAFISTLGMMMIARGLALVIAKGEVVYGVPKSFYFVGQGYVALIPVPGIILAVAALGMFFLLNRSRWGRHIYATGGNAEAARLFGVNVAGIYWLVYVLSGFFAGLTGLVYMARLTAGYCEGGVGYELNAIASVVIGGASLFGGEGNLLKVVVGAFILTIINNFMNLLDISPYTQEAMKGAVILIAVYVSMRR